MLFRKEEKSSEVFWQEYEEKTGEKILARGLGKYICGWDEFDQKKWGGIWGLLITTSGGFRFHHFPQHTWIDALTSFARTDIPKEKTIFLPQDKIISSDYITEKKWWKKILSPSTPKLKIKYTDENGNERLLLFEAEYGAAG
ncbi:MAG: hypothetical protein FWD14_01635 [Treponema sp.]|nr:hypothetical protein [Treponema sp.]